MAQSVSDVAAEDRRDLAAPRGPGWSFAHLPVFPNGPNGSKTPSNLAIGRMDDSLEREADGVADKVMQPDLRGDQGAKIMRPNTAGPVNAAAFEAPGIVHEALNSPGESLDKESRRFFEARFGYDFSRVRIHTDATASASAAAVRSLAYTVGTHVVFGSKRYAPGTPEGKRLLAHELSHVVQQSGHQDHWLQAKTDSDVQQSFVPAPAPGASPAPPPVPGSPEAVRAEAVAIGQKWGELLADRDLALDTLQTKHGGVSVWDRMKPEEKRDFANKVQDQFVTLPVLPQYDKPELMAAQDDGFTAGVQSGYSLEKFANFLVKLSTELAIALFAGLAARGVRLPRFISQALQRLLPAASSSARTAEEVAALIARVRIQSGRVVYNIGGRGAPGEPVGAINVNPEELPGGIPNQVVARGEEMDRLIPNGSGDEVFSRNLVGDIQWEQMARASKAVVKPGGTVTLSPWGGQLGELPQIQAAMEKAGFRNVRVEFGAVVKGER
jgi:Domain of unknown function (DUF4157)